MPYPGDFVYASSVFGKPGDKTTMDLPPFNAMKDSSLTFNVYHYGKSYLHVTADIKLSNGGHSAQVNYVSYFSVGWNKVCLDLEEGEASGVSFTTLRSQEPFSLVAVDDILYNEQPCPGKQTVCPYFLSNWVLLVINDQYWHHFKGTYIFWDICVLVVSVNCTFDEDLCGYTADSDWSLERRANSSTSKSFQIKCNKSFGNLIPLIGKSNQIHVPFATYSLPTKIIWRWAVWIFDYCHVPVTCQVCFFLKADVMFANKLFFKLDLLFTQMDPMQWPKEQCTTQLSPRFWCLHLSLGSETHHACSWRWWSLHQIVMLSK